MKVRTRLRVISRDYLVHKLEQGPSVLFPVFWQFLGHGVLNTSQLDGDLKTVCVYVVPVLHATWKKIKISPFQLILRF